MGTGRLLSVGALLEDVTVDLNSRRHVTTCDLELSRSVSKKQDWTQPGSPLGGSKSYF